MNTRKYPRTLEEAFGPYARGPIHEPQDPMPAAEKIVVVASAIALLAILGFALVGWL